MAAQQKAKPQATKAIGRNDGRRNGKKFGRHSSYIHGNLGHRLTGKSKPSGHSVEGYAAWK